jgi:integrase
MGQAINQLKVEHLQECINKTCPTFDTAKDVKTLLSHLYKIAMAQQEATTNLSAFLALPEHIESKGEPWDVEEVQKFWNAYYNGDKFFGYILLMIYTGMMPGELFIIQKNMIDWEKQVIIGGGVKTNKRKKSPIVVADQILPVLCDPGPKLLHMHKDTFYYKYYEALERVGVRRLPPYSCRHTTATVLALHDTALPIIKEVMRHTKITTTQKYIHIDVSPMIEALNRVMLMLL